MTPARARRVPSSAMRENLHREWRHTQEGIYDKFLERFLDKARSIKLGDPFDLETFQGPQVSQIQLDRVLGYIESGKADRAKVELGGGRHGTKGYFVEPTIFTNASPQSKIVREEIFGPVGVVIKFKDEADVVHQAKDTWTLVFFRVTLS